MDDDKDSCPSLVSDDEDLPPLIHLTTSHRAAQPAQQAQQTQQASAPRGMGLALPGRHSQGVLSHPNSRVVLLSVGPVWLDKKLGCMYCKECRARPSFLPRRAHSDVL